MSQVQVWEHPSRVIRRILALNIAYELVALYTRANSANASTPALLILEPIPLVLWPRKTRAPSTCTVSATLENGFRPFIISVSVEGADCASVEARLAVCEALARPNRGTVAEAGVATART